MLQTRHAPAADELALAPGVALARARAHEAAGPARAVFALLAAARLTGPVLWLQAGRAGERPARRRHPRPSSIPPASSSRRARKPAEALWAAEEALRTGRGAAGGGRPRRAAGAHRGPPAAPRRRGRRAARRRRAAGAAAHPRQRRGAGHRDPLAPRPRPRLGAARPPRAGGSPAPAPAWRRSGPGRPGSRTGASSSRPPHPTLRPRPARRRAPPRPTPPRSAAAGRPTTSRPVAADEQLARIAADPAGFLAALDHRDPARRHHHPARRQPGPATARLPSAGYGTASSPARSACAGSAGSDDLPPHVLGHIGYAVVPWKRRLGYATRALALLLPEARARRPRPHRAHHRAREPRLATRHRERTAAPGRALREASSLRRRRRRCATASRSNPEGIRTAPPTGRRTPRAARRPP